MEFPGQLSKALLGLSSCCGINRGLDYPTLLALLAIVLTFCVFSIHQFTKISSQTLKGLLWDTLVYIMPERLLIALEDSLLASPREDKDTDLQHSHARKSEVLGKLFGLDKGISPSLNGSLSLPGIRGISSLQKASTNDALPGLGNWDNSCYQNSVLQGLASLPALHRFLSEVEDSTLPKENLHTCITLLELIQNLNNPSNSGKRFWTPPELKSMSSWQQQDAQEYYSKVLDQIEKELLKAIKLKTSRQGLREIDSMGLSMSDKQDGPVEKIHGHTDTKIKSNLNPLEGLMAQRVGCTRCGYVEGLSMIPFNCLTVPLGKDSSYDIRDCLSECTALEFIESVDCEKCTLLKVKGQLESLLEKTSASDSSIIKEDTEDQMAIQLRNTVSTRLEAVATALNDQDFSEKTLSKSCQITSKQRVTTTKSRQAVIARPPQSLVIHINRSLFDEYSGMQRKNYANVRFPKTLGLGWWTLGESVNLGSGGLEEWALDPNRSMLSGQSSSSELLGPYYELQAVITHYGRHENGHYVCYRRHPSARNERDEPVEDDTSKASARWWRLSDDVVIKVDEEEVLEQGGVFMLFYERVSEDAARTSNVAPVALDSVKEQIPQMVSREEDVSTSPTAKVVVEGEMQENIDISEGVATSISEPVKEIEKNGGENRNEGDIESNSPTDENQKPPTVSNQAQGSAEGQLSKTLSHPQLKTATPSRKGSHQSSDSTHLSNLPMIAAI